MKCLWFAGKASKSAGSGPGGPSGPAGGGQAPPRLDALYLEDLATQHLEYQKSSGFNVHDPPPPPSIWHPPPYHQDPALESAFRAASSELVDAEVANKPTAEAAQKKALAQKAMAQAREFWEKCTQAARSQWEKTTSLSDQSIGLRAAFLREEAKRQADEKAKAEKAKEDRAAAKKKAERTTAARNQQQQLLPRDEPACEDLTGEDEIRFDTPFLLDLHRVYKTDGDFRDSPPPPPPPWTAPIYQQDPALAAAFRAASSEQMELELNSQPSAEAAEKRKKAQDALAQARGQWEADVTRAKEEWEQTDALSKENDAARTAFLAASQRERERMPPPLLPLPRRSLSAPSPSPALEVATMMAAKLEASHAAHLALVTAHHKEAMAGKDARIKALNAKLVSQVCGRRVDIGRLETSRQVHVG